MEVPILMSVLKFGWLLWTSCGIGAGGVSCNTEDAVVSVCNGCAVW